MEERNIKIALVALWSVQVLSASTEKRKFTCGFISNENTQESEALQFVVSNSKTENISISLKVFNTSTSVSLFDHENITTLIEGSHSKVFACAVSTVTGIPLIRLHGNKWQFDQCERAVDMSAGNRHLAHATFDVLNMLKWKRILLIFDESRFSEAGYFYLTYKKPPLTMEFIHLPKASDAEQRNRIVWRTMGQIQTSRPDGIVLYTSKENTEMILQQVPYQRHFPQHWILQGQASENLRSLPSNVVLAFKLPYLNGSIELRLGTAEEKKIKLTNQNHVALAHDAIKVVIEALNQKPCLSLNGTFSLAAERDEMFNCMKKVKFKGLTGSVQFDDSGKRTEISLEILNLRNNSLEKIGLWNSTNRAVFFWEPLPNNLPESSLAGELEGRKLKIVYVEEPPFIMTKKNADGTVSLQGYSVDLMNELSRILKFTYELYPSPDGFYGTLKDNGTWDGMIGEILKGNANMATGGIAITETREKVVDFSVPFMYYTEDVLLKKISSESATDLLQFMDPFESKVWIATLGVVIIISVAVFVINFYSPYGYKDDDGRGTSQEFSFFNSVWFALACILQQGGDNTPRSLSGRILTGCYWFCILIWVSTYTANLAAFLTVRNAAQPINSLEDIVRTSHKVAITASSSTYATFKLSQYEPHKKIWQRIQAEKTYVMNTSQGVQWVRDRDNFAFVTDSTLLKHFVNQLPCDLRTVPGLTTAKGLALTFRAHDPHTHDFTLAILRLHENDLLDQLRRKWWDNTNACSQEKDTTLSHKRIDLRSMLGVYVVFAVGLAVALLTLAAEIYWKRKAKRAVANKVRTMRQRETITTADLNYPTVRQITD